MKLVFDVGATHTRFARVSKGKIEDVQHIDTAKNADGISDLAERLLKLADGEPIEAVAGGLPGIVEKGSLTQARNLSAWQNVDVSTSLEAKLSIKPMLHNDTVGVGLGEMWHGAGTAKGVAAYVTVSTGVNAVRYVDGRVDSSISPFELGRQLVSGGVRQANDLESLIGGASVAARFGAEPGKIKLPAFWHQEAVYLARALYNLRLYWAPELVVLGGTMMRDIDIAVVAHELASLPQVWSRPLELEAAKLGSDGGLYGGLVRLETAQ